jgi:site-specific DNA recombinase
MTGTPTSPRRRRGRRAHTPTTPTERHGPHRVAIYIRRSTDDEHQPFSLDAQRAALTKYVKAQPGWTIVVEYEDDASGATTERPGLKKAINAAKAGLYDILLVYRIDRFSRSVANLLDLVTILEQAGVAFSSATEPIDTGGPFGRMILQLLAVFAEFERSIIIDRVKSGMTAKASKGKWAGGNRPYGYLIDPDTQRLVPHPDEAPILREIFHLYTRDRLGTRAIARPGRPGALLHRAPLRTVHATRRGTRPKQATRTAQIVGCSTVFPFTARVCLPVRPQVACTRCVRSPRDVSGAV